MIDKTCLFCKIISKKIHTNYIYENDVVVAFNDISPQAPKHILVIPKVHIATLNDLNDKQTIIIGEMVKASKEIAKKQNFDQSGYRTVFNCNKDAGQTVFHIHLHLLAGRPFKWPPG